MSKETGTNRLSKAGVLKSKRLLHSFMENTPDAICIFSPQREVLYANPAYESMYGWRMEEIIGHESPVMRQEEWRRYERRLKAKSAVTTLSFDSYGTRKNGGRLPIHRSITPISDAAGRFQAYVSIDRDISSSLDIRQKLNESEERYRHLVDLCPDGIVVHVDGKVIFVNQAAVRLCGARQASDLTGKSIFDFIPPRTEQNLQSQLTEFSLSGLDGVTRYLEVSGASILYHGQKAFMVILRDVTERNMVQNTINYMAFHDSLTGLPNRNRLHDKLTDEIRKNEPFVLMFLDLDRFKVINDSLGHHYGDEVLKVVTKRLNEVIADKGSVYRQGGDEFMILLPGASLRFAEETARIILQALSVPYEIQERIFFISASIGLSIFPRDGNEMSVLIRNADTALYRSKERGGNNLHWFHPDLYKQNELFLEMEHDLHRALEKKEFIMHYQPIVNYASRTVIGLEALVRWQHPGKGLIHPDQFIPYLEKTGNMKMLTSYILEAVCGDIRRFRQQGIANLKIAVNLSFMQFNQVQLIEQIESVLRRADLTGSHFEIEITESIAMNPEQHIVERIDKLKALGMQVSIDDFGTGYSSLLYLCNLPIDKIKIDREFVQEIQQDPKGALIVKNMIRLAQDLNLEVSAEGVETKEQLDALMRMGCFMIQGYYFARPMPADNVHTFFETIQI